MQHSKMSRRLVLAGAVAVVAGGPGLALAQPAGPGMMGGGYGPNGRGMMGGGAWGPMGGRGMGYGVTNMPGYLDALKAQLVITKEQEPAWHQYADTVSGVATQMQGLRQSMHTQMPQATWAQRREFMNQAFDAHQQAYETVHGAAEKLLPALDPQQRQTAQAVLPGLRTGGMMGGGPGMMGAGPGAAPPATPR
jgi:periplasmic protein CpxP/Spy